MALARNSIEFAVSMYVIKLGFQSFVVVVLTYNVPQSYRSGGALCHPI